jgi:GT2 family glycosyltransferase
LQSLSYPEFEVIVVDNGSQDGSVAMLRLDFPECLIIENSTNRGFCEANNQGIGLALSRGHDYILILNNDTLVDTECLGFLVKRAESDARIAAVTPKIYFAEPPDRIWFAGGTFSLWKGRNGHVGYKEQDQGKWNTPRDIEFACGCAFLAHRRVWERLGGFDKRFFWSAEDADWSLRATQSGYKLFYEPAAVVWHKESYSILRRGGKAGILYYWTRNGLLLMVKHGRWRHWITFVPYYFCLTGKRIAVAAWARDWDSVRAAFSGVRDFFGMLERFGKADPAECCRVPVSGGG